MFRHYVVAAVRNLRRQKGYAVINIFGLALGMACCILMLLFIKSELSYDRHHADADHIYRLYHPGTDGRKPFPYTPGMLGPTLEAEFPEIERAARVAPYYRKELISVGDRRFYENRFLFADGALLRIFTLPFVKGDPKTALEAPHSVVLTEEKAAKFFGEQDPIGQTLTLNNQTTYTVTGVLKDLPTTTTLPFDFLASLSSMGKRLGPHKWSDNNYFTYVLLRPGVTPQVVEEKISALVEKYRRKASFALQPLVDIYLSPDFRWDAGPRGRMTYIWIYAGIAALVLVTACINFVNLSVGLSATRSREVGVRKVVGAHRSQVMRQFWGEALLLSFLALGLGVALAELFLPTFNGLAGKALEMTYDLPTLMLFIGLLLAVGLFSGSYPALVLSGFDPVSVLKGQFRLGGKSLLGRGLVVFQVALCAFFVVCALLMSRQFDYLVSEHPGFDPDQVVVIPIQGVQKQARRAFYARFGTEAEKHPGVVRIAASDRAFGRDESFTREGSEINGIRYEHYKLWVDGEFLRMMDIELVTGRDFLNNLDNPQDNAVIVNETLVKNLGLQDPVGKPGETNGKMTAGPIVIGVVRDFHFFSLHNRIDPLAIYFMRDARLKYVFVRIRPEHTAETLAFLKATFEEVAPEYPFTYSFMDSDLERQYQPEARWRAVVGYASAFLMSIAALGIFGLATLAVSRRTREIGIRKVLGASVGDIAALISKEFVMMSLFAMLIAWPAAYYAMRGWLQNFAYRIDLGAGAFVLGGVCTLGMVLVAAGWQAVKAARSDPVDALRQE